MLALALALAVAAEPTPAAAKPAPAAADPTPAAGGARPPAAANVRTVSGKITALDWPDARFTIAAADGPFTVSVDRNTMVLLETRAGTVRDLAVGMPVRVNVDGARHLAFWVETRPRGLAPSAAQPGGAPADGPGTASAAQPDPAAERPARPAAAAPPAGPAQAARPGPQSAARPVR